MGSVLSVVVPIYNVAPYLGKCLSSIANQYYRDLEVIMVDDGSSDESASIAERFAATDPRFHLIRQPNRGLGAARNTGVDHATGDYLMFVDSDDVLPPYAAELLISAIEQSGSDFASGNVFRLTWRGLHQSGMHKQVFATARLRTHVSEFPDLLADRTAWNKVFRRQFWDAHELRFPEGVLYEDGPVMVPAHVLATSVDVLNIPVYYWRERDGGEKSITQRRDEVTNFLDRVAGVISVSRFLDEQRQTRLKRLYDASALRNDLMIFMRMLPQVDDAYRQVFLDRCNEFLASVDDRVVQGLPAAYRLLWTLTRHRMLPEMLEIIPVATPRTPIVRRGLRRYHDLPYLDAKLPQLPRSLYAAGTPRPRTRLHEVAWRGGRLRIRGHAYIPGQSAAYPWSTVRLVMLREEGGRRTRRMPVVNRRCGDATADAGRPDLTYDWSGFEVTLDPRILRGPDGSWQEGTWTLHVGVVGLGQKSEGPVEVGDEGHPLRAPAWSVTDDFRITPVISEGSFTIRVERVWAEVTEAWVTDTHLDLVGRLRHAPGRRQPTTAVLSRISGLPWRRYPVEVRGDRFVISIPVAHLWSETSIDPLWVGEPGDRFAVELAFADRPADPVPVVVDPRFQWTPTSVGARVVHLHPDAAGHLVLAVLPPGPMITEVRARGAGFDLVGAIPPGSGDWSTMDIVLRLPTGEETVTVRAEVRDATWWARVDPLATPTARGTGPLGEGLWEVLCRDRDERVHQLPLGAGALAGLPLALPADPQRVTLEWLRDERAVIRVRPESDRRGPARSPAAPA